MRALIFSLAMVVSAGHAKNLDGRWDNSPNKDWYEQQYNSEGTWCCDFADAEHYTGDYSIKNDGSVVLHLAGGDEPIAASKVLNRPNPSGHAIWWHVGETTYCFAIGPLY